MKTNNVKFPIEGAYETKRGVILYYSINRPCDWTGKCLTEVWTHKTVRKTGGWKRVEHYVKLTNELKDYLKQRYDIEAE